VAKRVELLHEVLPKVTSMALLVNPASPSLAEAATKDGVRGRADVSRASQKVQF